MSGEDGTNDANPQIKNHSRQDVASGKEGSLLIFSGFPDVSFFQSELVLYSASCSLHRSSSRVDETNGFVNDKRNSCEYRSANLSYHAPLMLYPPD